MDGPQATAVAPLPINKTNITELNTDLSPYEIRWCFNPVVREKILDARECGISVVPFAKFFPVQNFPARRENHTTDEYKPREYEENVSAATAQEIIEHALSGKGAQTSYNWGAVFGFKGETDAAKMEVISRMLLPTLSNIRAICEEHGMPCPIDEICQATDDTDFAPRESCVTCWFDWIRSDACKIHADIVAAEGVDVIERDTQTGAVEERRVLPSSNEFDAARAMMIEAFQVGVQSMQKQWTSIAEDEESGITNKITDHQHEIRKDLHKNKPADRQLAIVQQFAKASGTGGNADVAQAIAMMAQSQAQTNQLLAQMALGNQPAQNIAVESEDLPPYSVGDTVIAEGKKGTVVAKPFGRYKVDIEGKEEMFDREQLTGEK